MNEVFIDLNLLRKGGYILYARHGEATVGEDRPDLDFGNCDTQRNLSDLGRRQAVYYGELLRSARIPVRYPVQASPFCRAVETGFLSFGREYVQIDPFWAEVYSLSGIVSGFRQEEILFELRQRLERVPAQGINQVIIAHGFPAGVGLGEIPDMGTVVIRPLGAGHGYEIAARLALRDLAYLRY